MIARVRAWLGSRKQLAEEVEFQLGTVNEQRAVIARYGEMLSKEQKLTAQLTSDLEAAAARYEQQIRSLTAEREAEHDEVKRLTEAAVRDRRIRDGALAATGRSSACLCASDAGGWRRQAEQDRANAIGLADEVERLRLIAEEAERLHRVIELGRAGIAVVS